VAEHRAQAVPEDLVVVADQHPDRRIGVGHT
jgi:hypothetical protein